MSLVSNFHDVETFKAQRAFDGQRLVTLHYKERKIKGKNGAEDYTVPKFPTLCVSVPTLRLRMAEGMPQAVAQVTLALWEKLQDDLIKSLVDARRGKDERGNPNATSAKRTVADEEISLDVVAAFAAATGNGKISGDAIEEWYDSVLTEPLLQALIESDPDRTNDQCESLIKGYKVEMVKLAAVAPYIPDANIKQLRKAIARAPEDDQMATRLLTKLDALDKKQPAATLLGL